jgi:hypothetical protein
MPDETDQEQSTEELKPLSEGEAPEAPPVPTPAPISDQDDLTPAEG